MTHATNLTVEPTMDRVTFVNKMKYATYIPAKHQLRYLLPDDSALQVNKRNIPSAKSLIWFQGCMLVVASSVKKKRKI